MLFVSMEYHCSNCGSVNPIHTKIALTSADHIQIHPSEPQSLYCKDCGISIPLYNEQLPDNYSGSFIRWDDETLSHMKEEFQNRTYILEQALDAVVSHSNDMRAEIESLKRKLANNALVNRL